MTDLDPLGRTPLAEGMKRQIAEALKAIPEDKRAALIVVAAKSDGQPGEVTAHFAAKIGEKDEWKLAAGGGFRFTPDKPLGYGWFGIEKTW